MSAGSSLPCGQQVPPTATRWPVRLPPQKLDLPSPSTVLPGDAGWFQDLCGPHNREGLSVNRFLGGHMQTILTLETLSHESPVVGLFPSFSFCWEALQRQSQEGLVFRDGQDLEGLEIW